MEIFSQTIANILEKTDTFWGVISDERLRKYYEYFGIEIVNDMHNED
jgi:hypothetical protein